MSLRTKVADVKEVRDEAQREHDEIVKKITTKAETAEDQSIAELDGDRSR